MHEIVRATSLEKENFAIQLSKAFTTQGYC